jgi:aryl sulfotransferase
VRRYAGERNERWEGFEHRPGDVVISTRSKCGTTWLQMIVLMLVHGTTELPAPLGELSPWLDWGIEPIGEVRSRLAGQQQRRVIKTHTPLGGLPLDRRVSYLVAGRRPLDVAVSQYHHSRNINRVRFAELSGTPLDSSPTEPFGDWLDGWLSADWAEGRLDSLSGLAHHVADAREPRAGIDVRLVHFDDLVGDLAGEMQAMATWLGVAEAPLEWPSLVAAASFSSMSARPERNVPDRLGVLAEPAAFFRGGRVGDGERAASAAQRSLARATLTELLDADTLDWLDRSGPPGG